MKSKQSKKQSKKRLEEPSSYKVEKGIPVPTAKRKHSVWMDYARKMGADCSFLIPHLKTQTVSQKMQSIRKEFPRRDYTVRTVEGGARLWRLK